MDNNNLAREILQRITALETTVKDIVDNHLDSITKKLDKIGSRPSWIVVWIMGGLVSLVVVLLQIVFTR